MKEMLADTTSRRSATVVCYDQRGSTRAKLLKPEADWVAQSIKITGTILDTIQTDCPQVSWSFTGDGIMAFYDGDDQATVAVQHAMKVQEELAKLNRPANGAMLGVIDVKVSVGISTGEPWWFETTPGHPNVIGTCADTAARLCDAATSQAIFIDEETASVLNPKRLSCLYGKADGRTPQQYVGDKQQVALKGIPDPVSYFEILWEQQRFGVRSEMATPTPADPPRTPRPSAAAAGRPTVSLKAVHAPRPEKMAGKIKFFSKEKDYGFITSPTGEDFFFKAAMLAYPEDAADLEPGDPMAFLALEPSKEGENRRAGGVLAADEYADAVLVIAPKDQRRHGWFEIKDKAGHGWLLYAGAASGIANFEQGQRLEFQVFIGPRGAEAVGVSLPSEEEHAA